MKSILKQISFLFISTIVLGLFTTAYALTDDIFVTDDDCVHKFIDVVGHALEEEVCFLYSEGIINGDNNSRNFLPYNQITRAEFLKISLRTVGYNVEAVPDSAPNDVFPGDWYYQYVTYSYDRGFIQGYEDGSFRPNDPITRAEAVVMIMGIAEITSYTPEEVEDRFEDVDDEDWYADEIALAHDLGIITGYVTGYFFPDEKIIRADAASIAASTFETLYTLQD